MIFSLFLLLLFNSVAQADVWLIRGKGDGSSTSAGLYRINAAGEMELVLKSYEKETNSTDDSGTGECKWRVFDYSTLAISPDKKRIALIGAGEEEGAYEIYTLSVSPSYQGMVASCTRALDTETSQLLNTPITIASYPTGVVETLQPELECASKTTEQVNQLYQFNITQKVLHDFYTDRERGSGRWHWAKDDVQAINEEIKDMEEKLQKRKRKMIPGTISPFQWGTNTRFRLQWNNNRESIFIKLIRTDNPFFALPHSEIPLDQEDPSPCLSFKLQLNPNGTGTLQRALIPGQGFQFKSSSFQAKIDGEVSRKEAKILETFNSPNLSSRWAIISPDEKYLALWVEETIDHKNFETPFERESLILFSLSSSTAERADIYNQENPKFPLEGKERVLIWDASNTLWIFDPLGNYRRINMNPSKGWECTDWLCPTEIKASAIFGSIEQISSLYPTRFFIRERSDGSLMDYTLSYYTDRDFNEFLSHPDIPGFLISQFLHTGPSSRNLTKPRWTDDGETLLGLQNSGSFNHRYGQSSNVLLWKFQRGENGHFNGAILSDKTIYFELVK